jgi:hypothetical protein
VFQLQEIVMTSLRRPGLFSATVTLATQSFVTAALASQGPGAAMGTAGHLTQTAMAILVYGISAIIVGIGLIGAARGHQ